MLLDIQIKHKLKFKKTCVWRLPLLRLFWRFQSCDDKVILSCGFLLLLIGEILRRKLPFLKTRSLVKSASRLLLTTRNGVEPFSTDRYLLILILGATIVINVTFWIRLYEKGVLPITKTWFRLKPANSSPFLDICLSS